VPNCWVPKVQICPTLLYEYDNLKLVNPSENFSFLYLKGFLPHPPYLVVPISGKLL